MTSERPYSEAYVWVWLPDQGAPVVAGLVRARRGQVVFNYGRSYLARQDAMSLYLPELPLRPGEIQPLPGLAMPSCIRDASPDAWGRRVMINRKLGLSGNEAAAIELDELTYLLESGSDRVGALDFQRSATDYRPRLAANATLEELQQSAERVEHGIPLTPELGLALQHGTALGGARPKALIDDDDRKFIAKFSASTDTYNVVKAEFVAMRLAAEAGLNVASVGLTRALGKDVLLIERFDRFKADGAWRRRAMVSALTILELDEMMAPYASYETLAEVIRHRFDDPAATLAELFGRIVFNILCGNTDDHARNHAAFWNGSDLTLTPAYDICPQARAGEEASQAMLIHGGARLSTLANCLAAAPVFTLPHDRAVAIINHQVAVIEDRWRAVCGEGELSEADRRLLWRRQFLSPFAFYNAPEAVRRPGQSVA